MSYTRNSSYVKIDCPYTGDIEKLWNFISFKSVVIFMMSHLALEIQILKKDRPV